MKYLFEISSRVDGSQSAEDKHSSLINFMRSVSGSWGVEQEANLPSVNFGKEFTAIVSLNKVFGDGIKCTLFYRYRKMLADHHSCDDRIYFEFNLKRIDYQELIFTVFSKYTKIFNAYRSEIFPESLIYIDFEKSRHKNLRETVIRFYPIMFLDFELCKRTINKTPSEVSEILKNKVEQVEIFNNGVFYVGAASPMSTEECNEFDKQMRVWLLSA